MARYDIDESNAVSVHDTPSANAEQALLESSKVHNLLDDLETRLFGPSPKAVSIDSKNGDLEIKPPFARTLTEVRQRLESANDRLSMILKNL